MGTLCAREKLELRNIASKMTILLSGESLVNATGEVVLYLYFFVDAGGAEAWRQMKNFLILGPNTDRERYLQIINYRYDILIIKLVLL